MAAESVGNTEKMTQILTRSQRAPLSAGSAAVTDYLAGQIITIVDGDVGLRHGREPVHDIRVAIRKETDVKLA